jgi:crotonobetainyl-CoA:carnitine CoA-transferase CaiB-like acyl-CoA transferase
MDEKRIVGMAHDAEYAKWAHGETNPEDIFTKPEALDDMLVLDVSYGSYAGLFASSVLSELGAEVIRIEPPGGDLARKMSPYGMMVKDSGLAYLTEARNKFHVTLDISTEEGATIFKRLARKADVIIETFKPGYLDERGIGYRQLAAENPGLIYCPIHVYGQFGEDAEKAGNQPDYDIACQARGVVMSITGEPDLDSELPEHYKRPLKQGNWMGWYAGGAWAAFGILTAMYHKKKTGQGQIVDCSPPEGLITMSNYVMQYYHMTHELMPRAGNFDYAVFPYTYVKCKDGYTFISGFTDPNWQALCEIMDRPDLRDRFPGIKDRLNPVNQPEAQREIEKFTSQYTADELQRIVGAYMKSPSRKGTVVVGRLEAPTEVVQREHWQDRQTFYQAEDPIYGDVFIQNSSFKAMSLTPGRIKWVCRPIGADNGYVYNKYLGIGKTRLSELKQAGVV